MGGDRDWLDEVIRERRYDDPRIDGTILAFQLACLRLVETAFAPLLALVGRVLLKLTRNA